MGFCRRCAAQELDLVQKGVVPGVDEVESWEGRQKSTGVCQATMTRD